MVSGQVVAYNIASLICALFVLERGADVFIDLTAIVAQRTKIPQSAIALLTAGAEWEEVCSPAEHKMKLTTMTSQASRCCQIRCQKTPFPRHRKRRLINHFRYSWRLFP